MIMEKYYDIAGITVCVKAPEGIMYSDERMLAPFACGPRASAYEYSFTIAPHLPEPEGECAYSSPSLREYRSGTERMRYIGSVADSAMNAHICVRYNEKGNYVTLSSSSYSAVTAKSVLNSLGMEHLCVQNSSVIIHASYIITDAGAVLFTAPSGTGKSTQAQLWQELRGARTVNGDRAIIKITENGAEACPLPFSGSSQICENVTAPLAAIVALSQSPQTDIQRLSGRQAFLPVWAQCCFNAWDKNDTELALKIASEATERVSVYHLACTPDISAVEALEKAMGERI